MKQQVQHPKQNSAPPSLKKKFTLSPHNAIFTAGEDFIEVYVNTTEPKDPSPAHSKSLNKEHLKPISNPTSKTQSPHKALPPASL